MSSDDSKAILAKCEVDGCPVSEWVSEAEQRIRNSIPNAQTLQARAIGYNWGRKDESARLLPIITKLLEDRERLREALEISGEKWSGPYSSAHIWDGIAASDALVKEILK